MKVAVVTDALETQYCNCDYLPTLDLTDQDKQIRFSLHVFTIYIDRKKIWKFWSHNCDKSVV